MAALPGFTLWGMCVLLGCFAVLVVWKIFSAGSLSGLLAGDQYDSHTGSLSTTDVTAGRAQSLVFVVYFAVYYLIQILHSPSGFPPVPKSMLYALAGSQSVYLAGKTYDLILSRILDDVKKGLSR